MPEGVEVEIKLVRSSDLAKAVKYLTSCGYGADSACRIVVASQKEWFHLIRLFTDAGRAALRDAGFKVRTPQPRPASERRPAAGRVHDPNSTW